MKLNPILWSLLLASAAPSVWAQVLSGDSQFSLLHNVGWEMSPHDVRALFQGTQNLSSVTDSTLTLKAVFFGAPASTEIRFQQPRRGPAFVHIKFTEPTRTLVDTISSHFTRLTQKSPTTSVTEKKLFFINLRIEIAKWKTQKESIVLTTALRDETIGDVGLIISRFAD